MTPNISKELKQATETLHAKMLVMQQEEKKMMQLRNAFVKSADAGEKERLKSALILQNKKLKTAEAEATAADKAFHKILSYEPEEIYDLLDHKIQEHVVRLAVRKVVKESLNEANAPMGLSVKDTLKVADTLAKAISKVEGAKVTVNMKTLEEDSFDLDYNGQEFDGGSYNINDDGTVVNMSVDPVEVYGKVGFTQAQFEAEIKKANQKFKMHEGVEVSLYNEVEKFFNSNKKKLEKLANEDEWDDFYELAYEKFPDAEQDKVAQALNKVCMHEGWFEEEQLNEIPSEKDLEQMTFGDKSQQKGINMGDYDKKNKSPKQSPSELFTESKKKILRKR